ncbi:MAG: hypothetical protein WCQ26_09230 [Pseudanabaena sp. ELA748]
MSNPNRLFPKHQTAIATHHQTPDRKFPTSNSDRTPHIKHPLNL